MIKKADLSDLDTIVNLASSLWQDSVAGELYDSFSSVLTDDDCTCFLKLADGNAAGFAQCGLRRDYVEGTSSSPVGYLESIYVKPSFRKRGFATELLQACESWAKAKGCLEFASDCELSNKSSFDFHLKTGFEETNRIICFAKKL